MVSEWEDTWELEDFSNAYRNWMTETMGARRYRILFDLLHDTRFEWDSRIPRDEDRASCGRYLRLRFSDESGMRVLGTWLDMPCSFLEFLIGLAYSIEEKIMYDPTVKDQPAKWFWDMMSNIGLDKYTDEYMMREGVLAYGYVSEIADRVMKRRYEYNGYLGLFPLRKPEMDQRKVEIWYQANAYFIEKYFE